MDEGQAQQAAGAEQGLLNFLETMKRRRDEHIAMAARITRMLDYFEAHPDCEEFLKLFEELNSPLGS
jgi:hypothetical protein